jgi:RHS repeat-associated protein
VTDTYDYDAFGNLLHSSTTLSSPTPNEFLFAGEQFDPDLNLYFNRARYLNVATGRFWSMDAFEGRDGSPLSLHKYLYAGSDPVDQIDRSGNDFTLGSITITTGIQQTVFTLSVIQTQALVQGIFGAAVGAFAAAAGGAATGANPDQIDSAIQKNIFWGLLIGAAGTAAAAFRLGRLVMAAVSIGLGGSSSYVAFVNKNYGLALFYAVASLGLGWLTAAAGSAATGSSVAQQINTGTVDAGVVASATDQAAFYSGGDVATSAAQAFAKNENGILIGQTAGGQAFSAEAAGAPWAQTTPYWEALSKLFADGASGTVHAFVTQQALEEATGIFFRIELPALQANSKVFAIVLHVIP